ncbi:hypothetical protein GE21DRAFT_1271433 [Neurospora crassa]|nr:hypothetical protein GE21DRAFT_1271433 [Neurospora crassa]
MACDAKESMALDKAVKTLMPRLAGIRRNMVGNEMMLGISDSRLMGFFLLNSHNDSRNTTYLGSNGSNNSLMVIEIHLECWTARRVDIAISIGLVGSKSPQGLGRRAKPLTTRSAGWQIQRQGNANNLNGRQPSATLNEP